MSGGGSRVPLSSNLATPTAYKTPYLVKHGEGVLSFPGLYHECIPNVSQISERCVNERGEYYEIKCGRREWTT